MCWTGWGNPNRMETWMMGDSWRLLDSTTFCGTTEGIFAAFELPVVAQGTLAVALVPEPGRAGFIGLGLIFWLLRRKRRE